MTEDLLTMGQVAQQIALEETERVLANKRWAFEEELRDLVREHRRLIAHQSLLADPATRYIANSLQDPEVLKMVHREFFPSVMPVSVLFHVDGPVYNALLAASGFSGKPLPHESQTEEHMRTIQEPFGLPESMAAAVVAVHLAQSICNFHNKGRPLNMRLPSLTPEQCASLAMSGFNSPASWVERLYEFQDYLKVHISGNDHHEGSKDRYLSTVMSAANRQLTPSRMLAQVKAKADRVESQIRALEQTLATLSEGRPEEAPTPLELEKPLVFPESAQQEDRRMAPAQLMGVLSLQQNRKELARQLEEVAISKRGALSYQEFIQSPGVGYVLNSLMQPELVDKLFGEFSPVVYPDGIDYAMQSAAQGVLTGVAIELLIEGARKLSPGLDPWSPSRVGGDGEAGLIHRIAASTMAHQCGKWLEQVHVRHAELTVVKPNEPAPIPVVFSPEQYASLALSGFHEPSVWEELYSTVHGMLEYGNLPFAHMLPSAIEEAANRQWNASTVREQADLGVAQSVEQHAQMVLALARLDEEIEASPHRELVDMRGVALAPGKPLDLGLQSGRGGRAMIFRLLSLLRRQN